MKNLVAILNTGLLLLLISCGQVNTNVVGTTSSPGIPGPQGIPGPAGSPGPQGSPGPAATLGPDTPISLIAPCGLASSPYKEQIICLNNGSLMSSFSADMTGTQTRFSLLPVGTYEDTDSSGCVFTVTEDSGSYTISWNAGSNQYSNWSTGSQTCNAN